LDKRKDNGGHSTKATREDDKRLMTKSELQDVYENLKPFLPEALQQLDYAMKCGERWAVELWFKYFFSLPKTQTDITTQGEKIQNIINLGIGINPNTDEVQNIED
jgi:hypothetical protein